MSEVLRGKVIKAGDLRAKVANKLSARATALRCVGGCARVDAIGPLTVAHYLAVGWPKCCGAPMQLLEA